MFIKPIDIMTIALGFDLKGKTSLETGRKQVLDATKF
jgi:hypothetical protein